MRKYFLTPTEICVPRLLLAFEPLSFSPMALDFRRGKRSKSFPRRSAEP